MICAATTRVRISSRRRISMGVTDTVEAMAYNGGVAAGSKADGAVDDDRGDNEYESDLEEERRGTTARSSATQGSHAAS